MTGVFEKIIEKLEVAGKTEIIVNGGRCNGKTLAIGYTKGISDAIEIVKQEAEKFGIDINVGSNGWIPCNEPPKDDRYVILSFDNFSVPMVGRYEEDENGGAFYVGDDDETCVSQDIFVNAWMNLPAQYQPKGE